jgi:hypothetical protein
LFWVRAEPLGKRQGRGKMAAENQNGEVVSSQGECPDCSTTTRREHSFDELAKSLADGKFSRRGMLRMLGGALLGGALASIPGVAWAAKSGCASGVTCTGQCCAMGATCRKGKGKGCFCPPGQMVCSGVCRDLSTNVNNCGSCGNACTGGRSCVGGQCVCPTGTTLCPGNNTCVQNCPAGTALDPNDCQCNVCPPNMGSLTCHVCPADSEGCLCCGFGDCVCQRTVEGDVRCVVDMPRYQPCTTLIPCTSSAECAANPQAGGDAVCVVGPCGQSRVCMTPCT